jgi:septal ring factor EnvC (AmiA/AmiB activator)
MSDAVLAALITGGLSLIGIFLSAKGTQNKLIAAQDKQQAVFNEQIKELTREVREHNNFARRMPVVEEQIKVINHRIADLEHQKGES